MDRTRLISTPLLLAFAGLFYTFAGCAANPKISPTFWDRLGIPQAVGQFRDATLNRNGNFPALEKKPPVLKLADPANLKPENPEMIKAAAKIKMEKDMKKQKIKAIKFLADVNCGCYNKDGAVAKAFLAALDDCDPEVRQEALEGLCKASGKCTQCRTGCETTCCTVEILDKLQDIATGVDKNGCCKESVKEIRVAAASLLRRCPRPTPNPIEEIPAPPPSEVEEVPPPAPWVKPPETLGPESAPKPLGPESNRLRLDQRDQGSTSRRNRTNAVVAVNYRLHDTIDQLPLPPINNPEQLIAALVVNTRPQLGEILLELPEAYQLSKGWSMVIVDVSGNKVARIIEASGQRLLLALDQDVAYTPEIGDTIMIGRIKS